MRFVGVHNFYNAATRCSVRAVALHLRLFALDLFSTVGAARDKLRLSD
jgi:hypothetical protein